MPGAADTAIFGTLINATTPVALTVDSYIKSITFSGTTAYTINGPGTLHVSDAGNITKTTTGTKTIAAPIVLDGSTYSIMNNGVTGNMTIGTVTATQAGTILTLGGNNNDANGRLTRLTVGSISDGTGSVAVKVVAGASYEGNGWQYGGAGVYLNSANSYTGGTTVQGGLVIGHANALGSGDVQLNTWITPTNWVHYPILGINGQNVTVATHNNYFLNSPVLNFGDNANGYLNLGDGNFTLSSNTNLSLGGWGARTLQIDGVIQENTHGAGYSLTATMINQYLSDAVVLGAQTPTPATRTSSGMRSRRWCCKTLWPCRTAH